MSQLRTTEGEIDRLGSSILVYSFATDTPELTEEMIKGERRTPAFWFENSLHTYRVEGPISSHLLWMRKSNSI